MIYLDNSATTKQHGRVTDLMIKYMTESFGNPSSLYSLGIDSEKAIKKARKQVEEALGTKDGKVFFTSGGTESDNMALFGAAEAMKRKGRKIITSNVEHPAVLECCRKLEKQGFEVKYIDVDDKCRLDMDMLKRELTQDTILVSLMQVNNEVGTVMPVAAVKEIIKNSGSKALLHCDAVQSFGKLQIPVEADIVSVSAHKIHGPKGIGAVYIRNGVNIPELISGGGQENGKRSGTENVPAIAGFGIAAEIAASSRKNNMKKFAELREYLRKGLIDNIEDVIVNSVDESGDEADMCCPSLLSVSFLGTRGEVILHTLEQDDIYVSTGSACSSNKKGQSHVLSAMGLDKRVIEGTLRFSFGADNSIDEMDIVIDRVVAAVKRFRKLGSFR